MKTALQLYSLRDALMSGFGMELLLARVREMGYDGAELPGLLGYTPEEAARHLRDAGLEVFSLHVTVDDVLARDREMLRRIAAAGFRYLPIGWLPEERRAGGALFASTCEAVRSYAEAAREEGMTVLYHNHDFDLELLPDGRRSLDVFYETLPPECLQAELDTCWLYSGGADPVEYVRRYAGRTPILHLKDCGPDGGRHGFLPLGEGVLDFPALLAAAPSTEWFCVEQDDPSPGRTSLECAELSARYLKKLAE
ncbi:MAG: sugar phosphate isomerase/epimerase family protein [Eubacteriales bacterium]